MAALLPRFGPVVDACEQARLSHAREVHAAVPHGRAHTPVVRLWRVWSFVLLVQVLAFCLVWSFVLLAFCLVHVLAF